MDEFVAALLAYMRRSAKEFYGELERHAEKNWGKLEAEETVVLANELLIAYFWAVSKALANERAILDSLHDRLVEAQAKTAPDEGISQSQLVERYERYYRAFDIDAKASGGTALSFEMAQFFFPKRRPILDFFLQYEMQVRIMAFMQSVLELRRKCEIAGT